MNTEMAYLIGMVCGNGDIKRSNTHTIISIAIPHKKLETEDFHDVKLYVKASISDIRGILEPLIGLGLNLNQERMYTILSFSKSNDDYLIREILRMISLSSTRDNMRIPNEIFKSTFDEKKYFLKGFADVTGYIRRSNYFFEKYMHRVYLEIPNNWDMVIDIANLLKSIDLPISTIDWAHPNMRDGNLKKYNQGNIKFWKKEHQIKIWANEFLSIGFGIIHKQQSLETFSNELVEGLIKKGVPDPSIKTHKYYWDGKTNNKEKPIHPGENDDSLPIKIRGKHYNSWKDIAKDLGYVK